LLASISEVFSSERSLLQSLTVKVWDANPSDLTQIPNLQLLTWNDLEGKNTFWHSSAHFAGRSFED